MKATAKFKNMNDVEVSITLSMTLEECRALTVNMEKNRTWPNFQLEEAIKDVVHKKLDSIAYTDVD